MVQECVRGTTERGADIESKNKFSGGVVIRCMGHGETAILL